MGGRVSRDVIVSQLNDFVSEEMTNFKQDCQLSTNLIQSQIIECDRPEGVTQSVSANRSCLAINEAIALYDQYLHKARASGRFSDAEIEEAILTWDLTTEQSEDPNEKADFEIRTQRLNIYACSSCVSINNAQVQNFLLKDSCFQDSELLSKIQNSMTAKVQQSLENRKDVLANLAKALQFGTDELKTSVELTNRVKNLITANAMSKVIATTYLEQNMQIERGSSSVYFANNTQKAEVKRFVTAVQVNKVFNDILTDAETKALQKLVDKSDTLGDLLAEIDKTVDAVGKDVKRQIYIILVVVLVLGIAFAVIFISLFSRKKKKAARSN
jgi:hypothetical protein